MQAESTRNFDQLSPLMQEYVIRVGNQILDTASKQFGIETENPVGATDRPDIRRLGVEDLGSQQKKIDLGVTPEVSAFWYRHQSLACEIISADSTDPNNDKVISKKLKDLTGHAFDSAVSSESHDNPYDKKPVGINYQIWVRKVVVDKSTIEPKFDRFVLEINRRIGQKTVGTIKLDICDPNAPDIQKILPDK